MKLTKYGHACVVLEEQGKKLVIDPGVFTDDFGGLDGIVAVVVTHVHPDHFNPQHLDAIFAANPDAKLFSVQEVAEQYAKAAAVHSGQQEASGPFALRFSGEMHELIHDSLPRPHNTAVTVNDAFFYPGDSYTLPDAPVRVLAVPANAPWMKIADSIDYIAHVKPERCLPTHNGLLSEAGHTIYNGGLKRGADAAGAEFVFLRPGESLDI